MKIMVRFLHSSDLHLDRPFKGLSELSDSALQAVRQSTFSAWQKIVQYAIDEQPDFVLLVGDSYDGSMRSLRAQKELQKGLQQLHTHNIPVIISCGANDYTEGDWARFTLPDNVTVLPTKTTTLTLQLANESIKLTGCSYAHGEMPTALLDTYPQADKEMLHIAMLYGEIKPAEAAMKHYDYLALGGRHQHAVIQESPRMVYCGTPQSTSTTELGNKGFYDVTLTKDNCVMHFVRSAPILYVEQEVDASDIRYANDLMVLCHKTCSALRDKYPAVIVQITLINLTVEGSKLWHSTKPTEWLAVLRDMESEQLPLVWLAGIDAITSAPRPVTNSAQQVIETMHSWSADDWQDVLSEIYQSGTVARLMQEQALDMRKLLHEAEQLFLRKMQGN